MCVCSNWRYMMLSGQFGIKWNENDFEYCFIAIQFFPLFMQLKMPKDTSIRICFSNRFWQPLQLRLFHISWMENTNKKSRRWWWMWYDYAHYSNTHDLNGHCELWTADCITYIQDILFHSRSIQTTVLVSVEETCDAIVKDVYKYIWYGNLKRTALFQLTQHATPLYSKVQCKHN